MKHFSFLPAFVLFIASVQASVPVSLGELIEKGLQQNYQIRIAHNEQQISDNNATPGNAGMLPTLDVNGTFGGTEYNNAQFPADGSAATKMAGVSNSNLSAAVNLNWTLFDGFNIQANYAKLKELQQAGALHTRMDIESYLADLSAAYYDLVQQTIRISNLKSAVGLSKERLRIVEARYNIGNLSRLDLQQARVDFNTDSSRLIRQQEVLHTVKVRLHQLVADEEVERAIEPADTSITVETMLNKEMLWSEVLQHNTYLQLAEKEKNIKAFELQSARSSNYPYLKVNAGYGYFENRYEYGQNIRQNNLGLNYGLTLGYNIFDGFNRSRRQKNARLQLTNQELMVEQLQLSIKSDFSNLWMAYHNNLGLKALEQENLLHARENYAIAIERYKLGELSGIELREAQNSLLDAEERLVQAAYTTKLCEISLLEISGGLLKHLASY
jgi:outer membrane protein TolC